MNGIKNYLEAHKNEMIDLLAELVAIPSVLDEPEEGCPFGKYPAAALNFMLKKCSEYGFAVDNVENYAGSAEIPDMDCQLGILTHLDVVPADTEGWSSDPFTLSRSESRLTGRGTIDDKGPAVAAVFALRAVKELGIPLKKGVRLIFGTDEENGSADLAYYRQKRALPPMIFTPDGEYPLINGEKGMLRIYFSAPFTPEIRIDGGSVINAVPENCAYSFKNRGISGIIHGKAAHASTPEKGENAITLFLNSFADESPILKSIQQIFQHGDVEGKAIFGDNSRNFTCVLSMLKTVEKLGNTFIIRPSIPKRAKDFEQKFRMSRKTTKAYWRMVRRMTQTDGISVRKIGTVWNRGAYIKGGVDIRFPMERTKAEISDIICSQLRSAGFEIDSCEGVEPHYTDENSDFVRALLRVYERVSGLKGECLTIGGGTYVHEISGGVAFGAQFPDEDCRMHSPDEFITVDNLLKNAEIMAESIVEICG